MTSVTAIIIIFAMVWNYEKKIGRREEIMTLYWESIKQYRSIYNA